MKDEKRMEKLKKRLDELELITNNVKLLNEMLSHYKPESAAEHEKQIIEVNFVTIMFCLILCL